MPAPRQRHSRPMCVRETRNDQQLSTSSTPKAIEALRAVVSDEGSYSSNLRSTAERTTSEAE
jgi:hypothetical protein